MGNVKDKSIIFAKRIIKLYKYLIVEKKEFILYLQINNYQRRKKKLLIPNYELLTR